MSELLIIINFFRIGDDSLRYSIVTYILNVIIYLIICVGITHGSV